MDFTEILHYVHQGCIVAIVALGLYGLSNAILLHLQLRRRVVTDAEAFLEQVTTAIEKGDFEGARQQCTAPEYWYSAVALLTKHALGKRHMSPGKLRHSVAARFTREILAPMDSLIASVNMVIKCEPMLGLFGTVAGMIGAFGRIATIEHPSPQALMADLSHALNATAGGLATAIPLMLAVNFLQARVRKFEDGTFDQMDAVLDEFDSKSAAAVSAAPAVQTPAQPAAARSGR